MKMKKMMTIVFAYSVFSLVVCSIVALFFKRPELMPSDVLGYTFFQGVLLFAKVVPAVVLSGFLVACAITFTDSSARFIFGHFKSLMVKSIILVGLVFVFVEAVSPLVKEKMAKMEAAPVAYNDLMALGKKNLDELHATLASKYASDAMLLNPKSEEARKLYEDAIAAKDEEKKIYSPKLVFDNGEMKVDEAEGNFSYHGIGTETADSLLKKSDEATADKKWLDAHYYADLAESFVPEGELHNEAKKKARSAWEKLNQPPSSATSEEMELFAKKSRAYLLLTAGRNIEAYYAFSEISKSSEKASKDPDVQKYLEIASERVNSEYFFIDELDDFKKFEADKNVHFSIKHADNSCDVVFIRGITPIKSSSGMVNYLRGFSLYSYDKDGRFIRSVYAPYAKLFSRPLDSFNAADRQLFSIQRDFKNLPYILLYGLDSDDPERVSKPVFEFASTVLKKERTAFLESKYLLLGISDKDFSLICASNSGPSEMSIFSLWKIFHRADDFGYSSEIFGSTLIMRLTYPVLLLCMFMFLACVAWSYKLSDNQLFKFKWVVLVPISTGVIYFVLEVVQYVMSLLNFIFIWFSGRWSVFMALFVEIAILVMFSWRFIRKDD